MMLLAWRYLAVVHIALHIHLFPLQCCCSARSAAAAAAVLASSLQSCSLLRLRRPGSDLSLDYIRERCSLEYSL